MMLNGRHITTVLCECGAAIIGESWLHDDSEDRRFACGRVIHWSSRGLCDGPACPRSHAAAAYFSRRLAALTILHAAVDKLDVDDQFKMHLRDRLAQSRDEIQAYLNQPTSATLRAALATRPL